LKVNEEAKLTAAPDSWDWRDKGAVSDVIDQGNCHSSWASAVVGAVEGARVAQGLTSLVDLSVQEVLDCAGGAFNHGCVGGLVDDAYLFIQQNGLTTDEIYPYIGKNQSCIESYVRQNVTIINNFFDVPAQDSGLLIHQIGMTPVVSQVDVDSYVWQFYNSGVINKYCKTNVRHSVLLVGYSQTASPAYYIAKNSWGQDWGESGYVRIGIFGGAGVCGIQQLSSYPTF
jgi:KDEL-tailed cysteine endopeptidase